MFSCRKRLNRIPLLYVSSSPRITWQVIWVRTEWINRSKALSKCYQYCCKKYQYCCYYFTQQEKITKKNGCLRRLLISFSQSKSSLCVSAMFAVQKKALCTSRYIAIRMAVFKYKTDHVIGLLKTLQRLTINFIMKSEFSA